MDLTGNIRQNRCLKHNRANSNILLLDFARFSIYCFKSISYNFYANKNIQL